MQRSLPSGKSAVCPEAPRGSRPGPILIESSFDAVSDIQRECSGYPGRRPPESLPLFRRKIAHGPFAALLVAHQDSCAHTTTHPHFTFFLNFLRVLQHRVRRPVLQLQPGRHRRLLHSANDRRRSERGDVLHGLAHLQRPQHDPQRGRLPAEGSAGLQDRRRLRVAELRDLVRRPRSRRLREQQHHPEALRTSRGRGPRWIRQHRR